jgi:general stress protein 26
LVARRESLRTIAGVADDNYEDLTECALSPEIEEQLVNTARECVFMWTNRAGEAFGVVMAYLPKDGKIWMTAAERRARISAIRRYPRASVCVNSTGTPLGGGKTVTYKGECVVHDDRVTKDWFYPEFAAYLRPDDPAAAKVFQQFLDSPARVIIEFTPDYKLSFDSALMWARSPGVARKQ